jgi:hypothetical protein
MNATARQVFRHVFGKCWPAVILVTALSTAPAAWAAFGEVVEKPVPEFSRQGDRISARLIPRAKSTSVQIQFSAAGAKLLDVEGLDFEKAERPEVDVKNFKSGLFIIHLGGVTPGGEAKVSLTSDFFISATQFYVFNASLPQPWIIADAANLTLPDRVQDYTGGRPQRFFLGLCAGNPFHPVFRNFYRVVHPHAGDDIFRPRFSMAGKAQSHRA